MADIRITDLPLATGVTAPVGTDSVAIDGPTTRKTTITSLGDVAVPIASQAEAESGSNAIKRMTPLTVKQSISSEVGATVQGFSSNLNTLAAVVPGASGLSILTLAAVTDVRNYLDSTPYVSTRASLKAIDTTKETCAILTELGREGTFIWRTGNYSSQISGDTQEGVFLKSDFSPSSSGAWVRENYNNYNFQNFTSISGAVTAVETSGGGVLHVLGGASAPSLPSSYTGTVIDYDGPLVDVNFYAESGLEDRQSKRAWKMQHTGPHIGKTLSGFHIQSTITGSGQNGPNNADIGQSISHVKKNAQSGATVGEIDGLYIVARQGGPAPTSRQASSDWAGILVDSSGFGNCGHGFAIETALRNLDSAGNVLFQVQSQVGGIETNWAAYNPDGSLNGTPLGTRYVFGFNAQMVTGQGDVAYLVEGSANWTSAFRINSVEAIAVFDIRNTGEFWQGSGSNRIKHKHNAGAINLTNSADVPFASLSPASGIIAGDFNAANGLRIQGAALAAATRLEAVGADANVDLQALAKGTGYVMLGRSTNRVGFYGSAGVVKPTVTGAKGGNTALTSLIAQLVNLNLITDSTT